MTEGGCDDLCRILSKPWFSSVSEGNAATRAFFHHQQGCSVGFYEEICY